MLRILLAFAHHERGWKEVYCCLKRNGCSVLPKKEVSIFADKKKFKQYPIGYFHIDIAEVRTAEGKLYLYVAIDRTSKFSDAELHKSQTSLFDGL
ncbi:IS481 family transposase domain protein [Rickettsiales endosymbiont of Paramecium tredecaurelia]|nr:IS481 family transposase domain protein [Candidatus Sarmatiella mevalonica]